jgi:CheY-like chemotaxis protein
VRGFFTELDDDVRDRLLAEADEHDALRAEFTEAGTFTYGRALDAFSFRYQLRVRLDDEDDDRALADATAEQAGLDRANATLDDAGITLDLELPQEPLRVNGDRTRLAQVLSNLLSNAAKFTDAGGSVTVRVTPRADGRRVAVSVKDTGIGMTPEMLHRVFDTFSQADESLDRSKGGLGLGLALAKGLIQLHDGDLRAYSGGLARGSEFTFTLPLDSRHVAPASTIGTQPEKLPAEPQHRNLLLVEDNRDAAETLSELLELWGYTVWVAHNGPAGLQAALTHKPEIAILDIGLPGMDGFELAQKIHAELESIVLVALTGYGQDEDRRRSREVGFNSHLVKPLDPDALSKLLSRLPSTDVEVLPQQA